MSNYLPISEAKLEARKNSSLIQCVQFLELKVWWESQKERNNFEDQDVSGRMILKFILADRMMLYGLD
jgi:hypothetical protein